MAIEDRSTQRPVVTFTSRGEAPIGINPLIVLNRHPRRSKHARMVLAFVRDWNVRKAACELDSETEWGLMFILDTVDDALRHAGARLVEKRVTV